MGTGLNVQNRATLLHHVDGAYRRTRSSTRNGRIVRRGNQNDEVGIAYYPLEGSTEGFQWAHVSRKDNFLREFALADLDATIVGRTENETGTESDLLAALSADEPLLMDRAVVDATLKRLDGDRAAADGTREYHSTWSEPAQCWCGTRKTSPTSKARARRHLWEQFPFATVRPRTTPAVRQSQQVRRPART